MKPIDFPERNAILAKDQPQYLPLPVYRDHDCCVSCWQLTWRERFKMLFSGKLWLSQLNFSQPLQPQRPSLYSPFAETQ